MLVFLLLWPALSGAVSAAAWTRVDTGHAQGAMEGHGCCPHGNGQSQDGGMANADHASCAFCHLLPPIPVSSFPDAAVATAPATHAAVSFTSHILDTPLHPPSLA